MKDPRRLTRWETVGAWLRIWTPPRDAQVPPVPRGKAAACLTLALLALGGALAFFVPRIETGKERHAAQEARELSRVKARERRRLAAEQRLRTGRSSRRRPAGLPPARERRLRRAVIGDLERSITADARARVRRKAFDGPILRTTCEPYPRNLDNVGPETTLRGTTGRYSCTAVQHDIPDLQGGKGEFGYPFWAKVHFRDLTYAWCKINPRPGERTVGQELVRVPVPKACDLGY